MNYQLKSSLALLIAALALAASTPIVDEDVKSAIAAGKEPRVILHFNNGKSTSRILDEFREIHRPTERSVLPHILPNMLMANANRSQALTIASIKAWAATAGWTSFELVHLWMMNLLAVPRMNDNLLNLLMANPAISRIREDKVYQMIDPFESSQSKVLEPMATPNSLQWNVLKVGADLLHAKGYNGTGVTIGIIDTGGCRNHVSIKDQHRSDHGWFDATWSPCTFPVPFPLCLLHPERKKESFDDNGHGCHCAGTAVGAAGLGVAPGAQWIACKGLDKQGSGSESWLLKCWDFMLCPTNAEGGDPRCHMRPDVISNSWGSSSQMDSFKEAIDLCRHAGIIPVFAIGNAGPDCNTGGYPGAYPGCISVGATNNKDVMASFSSKGPVNGTLLKPDISAPGEAIKSASHTSDTGTVTMSGTSMACPAVAGFIALIIEGLRKSNQTVSYEKVYELITRPASTKIANVGTCGGIPEPPFPNNGAGWGQVSAANILETHPDLFPPQEDAVGPVVEQPEVEPPAPTSPAPFQNFLSWLEKFFQMRIANLLGVVV